MVWEDYTARPVHYNALLAEVGGLDPDTEASQGFAPAEIIEKVKQFRSRYASAQRDTARISGVWS